MQIVGNPSNQCSDNRRSTVRCSRCSSDDWYLITNAYYLPVNRMEAMHIEFNCVTIYLLKPRLPVVLSVADDLYYESHADNLVYHSFNCWLRVASFEMHNL